MRQKKSLHEDIKTHIHIFFLLSFNNAWNVCAYQNQSVVHGSPLLIFAYSLF